MRITLILLALCTSPAFAKGPFGDVTGSTFKYGSDQSKCTAEHFVKSAVEDTGIEIVDGKANFIWECKNGEGPATAKDRRCPYDQYMKADAYKCYSNVLKGYPYICVSGAHSDAVEEKYAGSDKPQSVPRTRFSQAFVVQSDKKDKNIVMDSNGCEATEVGGWDSTGYFNNGSTNSAKSDCVNKLKASLNEGYIYPPSLKTKYSPARPGVKYCDASKSRSDDYVSAHLTAIKDLYHCYEAYPNLDKLLGDSYRGKSDGSSTPERPRAVH